MEVLKHVEPEKFKIIDYKKFVLVGDIGGTHLSLAVFGISDSFHKIFSTRSHTKDHADPIQPINETLKKAYETYGIAISDAVFAAAGPVVNDRKQIRLTNANLLVDAGQILSGTMLGRVALLNDVEALGYAVGRVDRESVETIQSQFNGGGNDLVVAVGTGLNGCISLTDPISKMRLVVALEAGHTAFAVKTTEDFKLADFIRSKFGYVENEHVISGRGLENLYNYLKMLRSPKEKDILNSSDKAAAISRCALAGNDGRCLKAFSLLFHHLGRFTSDLAILSLAKNIYLGGGVVTRNLPLLKESFLQGFFENKSELLKDTSILAFKNYDANLYGCVNVAMNYMEELGFKK